MRFRTNTQFSKPARKALAAFGALALAVAGAPILEATFSDIGAMAATARPKPGKPTQSQVPGVGIIIKHGRSKY